MQLTRRRIVSVAVAGLLAAGAAATTLVAALPASAATLCDQFATVVAGNYVIMNNRWGTSATQCINTTASGFSITKSCTVSLQCSDVTRTPAAASLRA